jgi:hypothetical protein
MFVHGGAKNRTKKLGLHNFKCGQLLSDWNNLILILVLGVTFQISPKAAWKFETWNCVVFMLAISPSHVLSIRGFGGRHFSFT